MTSESGRPSVDTSLTVGLRFGFHPLSEVRRVGEVRTHLEEEKGSESRNVGIKSVKKVLLRL